MLPLAGFVGLSWFQSRLPRRQAGWAACAAVGGGFLLSLALLGEMAVLEPGQRVGNVLVLYEWVRSGAFSLDLSILIDPLSVF
ncbi:MAG: NADH-quinone oxidoreductase subunit L, partial [Nitrospinaceae bacterium]|nr:NADH-quinone oxidoreductase subunit L [Nitrospinaceae bacterium]NIR53435.1 NADH-quinone oxidoreductase subunit L [Nitrospinaceae bacterium]NIS83839.1 NADH-quinone oxidoreductase subunit L [Nitrospinaceae bacterium]NIT80630.1 NADH-quinone oxidoreductase subunit L [Nitrospinaceae bacterium]NIU42956.1 NADH-quinone oxidoreductase subunit L [Nitrospinaceae bacterium]